MRVLITGGAGFIGSHIVDALVTEGHEVAVVDNLSAGIDRTVNPAATVYNVSVSDPGALEDVFARVRPEVVNHHAAQISVRRSMADPASDAQVNVVGSINLLELCVKHNVPKFIFASSGATYSEPRYIPMDESHPVRPQSAYGVAKYTVENYIRLFSDVYGLKYKVFRYGNIFGPGQNPEGEAGVVAIFTRQMLGGVQPTIYGDGSKTRDYVFVEDVVKANLLAMSDAGDDEIFNIARGVEVSDFEVFDAVRQATGVSVEPAYAPKRPGEADRVSLDATKAQRVLEWTPRVGLEEGVRRAVGFQLRGET